MSTRWREALDNLGSGVDWDGWRARDVYLRAMSDAIDHPSIVLAALAEAHDLDAVLLTLDIVAAWHSHDNEDVP